MTVLFFLWGFMTVFNDILIPRFKEAFTLDYFEAMLVQFAFFGAYFIGALIYFVISVAAGDPIAKIGYKNGVVIGLVISATGSAIFWPAASAASYPMFLCALFVVGLGFAMLQIAANPYVTILGPETSASSRLNLAQGFNSVGTTIGPLIGGWLIFQYFAKTGAQGADSVKIPYLIFSLIFAVMAVIFFFIHLPHVGEGKIERGAGALKYPHVILGVIAIFMYVGGEVSVGSSIINFLGQKSVAALGAVEASKYVSLFWGGMLMGRFMGAVELSELTTRNKQLLLAAIPLAGVDHPLGRAGLGIRALLLSICDPLLDFVPVWSGDCSPYVDDFRLNGRCSSTGGHVGRGQSGDVVRGWRWIVQLHWLVQHLLVGPGRNRSLEKSGIIPSRHGDSWRGHPAAPTGRGGGWNEEPPTIFYCATASLSLCGILRLLRSPRRSSVGNQFALKMYSAESKRITKGQQATV